MHCFMSFLKSQRSQIIAFMVITFIASWTLEYKIIKGDGVKDIGFVFLLMWTPGIVGIVLSLLTSKNLNKIGFKVGNWKYYVWAYCIPAVTAMVILLTLILSGQGQFEINPKLVEKSGSLGKALSAILLKGTTLGVVIGFVAALGEEIGWRGFLHSRLMESKVAHPFVVTGVIWAIWHWPLILFSNYATSSVPVLSMCLFSVVAISFSAFMGWLRERSGSVFTVALAHAAHNAWIQGIYPAFLKKGSLDELLGGEAGVLNALLYLLVAIFIYKKYLTKRVLKPQLAE